jgi:arylsulfatase A-like enzyme
MGEHNFSGGKSLPYTEDILVPFVMRGPGITPGTTITQFAANIDIAPTVVDIAGGKTADFVDGRSLMPFFDQDSSGKATQWRNGLLIEAGYTDRKSVVVIFRSIRTASFLYIEFGDGTIEYYNLIADPYETNNIASQMDESTLANLHSTLEQLESCQAEACRTLENSLP